MAAQDGDTIVAIATPRGEGGVGVVRLSGPDALRIGRGQPVPGPSFALGGLRRAHRTLARMGDSTTPRFI